MTTGKWAMPEWMEPYRELIQNTAGNTIERLMDIYNNDHRILKKNMPLGVLAIACASQVQLLYAMRSEGILPTMRPGERWIGDVDQ